MKNWWTN